jgi:hypothetical protein
MDSNPLVIQSVYTDGLMLSVYTDWIIDGIYRFFKKKQFDDVEVFGGDFTDGMTEGFKLGSPYSDVTNSPSELLIEAPIEIFHRWSHR